MLECNGSGWNYSTSHNRWVDGYARNYLKTSYYDNPTLFSGLEKALIAETTLKTTTTAQNKVVNTWYFYDPVETQDYVFLLSLKEADTLYPDAAARARKRVHLYFRTPAYNSTTNIAGLMNGQLAVKVVDNGLAIAPAFNLDAGDTSIMFTSAIDFTKKSDLTDSAAMVSASSQQYWTLTLEDGTKEVSIDTTGSRKVLVNGDTVIVPFSCKGDNVNQISVMLTDGDFADSGTKILYYGALQDPRDINGAEFDFQAVTDSADKRGTGTFTIPSGYDPQQLGTQGANYKIYIMAEANNTDAKKTSYASEPMEITLSNVVAATQIDSLNVKIELPEPNDSDPDVATPDAIIEKVNGSAASPLKDKIEIETEWVDNSGSPLTPPLNFNTDYTVNIKLTPKEDKYFIGGGAEILVNDGVPSGLNNNLISGTSGDYYETTIQHEVKTRLIKLDSIEALSPIPDIPNGTPVSEKNFKLYANATLNLEDGSQDTAPIIWDLSSFTYDPNSRAEQRFNIEGRVDLAGLNIDEAGKSLEVRVEVTVVAAQEIADVAVTIDQPEAGISLATQGTVSTLNIISTAPNITWTKADGSVAPVDADYYAQYTAEFTLVPDIGYAFGQSVSVMIGTEPANGGVVKNTDESITVKHTFAHTRQALLDSITKPAAIDGINNGISVSDLLDLLSRTYPGVEIIYEGNKTARASVEWDVASSGYDPAVVTEQVFAVSGTVTLPPEISDNGNSLMITVDVKVLEAGFVGVPQATPGTGTYSTNLTVYLVAPTTNATIYYTTDGSDPKTGGNAVEYTGAPIDVTGTEGQTVVKTIKAYASEAGMQDSAVVEFIYTINIPQAVLPTAGAPVARPGTGTYKANQQVSLIPPTPDATIYYTMDGNDPSTGSQVYSGPIDVRGIEGQSVTIIIKAIAVKSGMNQSPVATFEYVIDLTQTGGGGNTGGGGSTGGGTGGNTGGSTGGGGNTGGNTGSETGGNTAAQTPTGAAVAAGIVAATDRDALLYHIIDGAESRWLLTGEGSGGDLIFRGSGDFNKFVEVRVDGISLDSIHYELKAGSTIVTLKESYLKTLPEGIYTLRIVWTDGSAETSFIIGERDLKDSVPKTGVPDGTFWLVGLTLMAGAGMLLVGRKKEKGRN
ncbi:MAG: chitobiase/beta-hexosaminidase C-terminal domain-containing protein [Lachnospiraceae bacterium]